MADREHDGSFFFYFPVLAAAPAAGLRWCILEGLFTRRLFCVTHKKPGAHLCITFGLLLPSAVIVV